MDMRLHYWVIAAGPHAGKLSSSTAGTVARLGGYDIWRHRRLEVTRHARNHDAGSARSYHVFEHFQSQRDAKEIHSEYDFRRGLLGRKTRGVNNRGHATARGGQGREFGDRLLRCDVDVARDDVMTVIGQLTGTTLSTCVVFTSPRTTTRPAPIPAGDGNAHGPRHAHRVARLHLLHC